MARSKRKPLIQTRFLELLAIKQRREGRKITREMIAQETGLSLTSVQNWATGQITRFDDVQIATFCKYFDCEIKDLLIMPDQEENNPEAEAPALELA